jgi:hypothetical protein
MAWEVDDIQPTVAELQARGVLFEAYDLPGLKTVDGMVEVGAITLVAAVLAKELRGSATARAICSVSASQLGDALKEKIGPIIFWRAGKPGVSHVISGYGHYVVNAWTPLASIPTENEGGG